MRDLPWTSTTVRQPRVHSENTEKEMGDMVSMLSNLADEWGPNDDGIKERLEKITREFKESALGGETKTAHLTGLLSRLREVRGSLAVIEESLDVHSTAPLVPASSERQREALDGRYWRHTAKPRSTTGKRVERDGWADIFERSEQRMAAHGIARSKMHPRGGKAFLKDSIPKVESAMSSTPLAWKPLSSRRLYMLLVLVTTRLAFQALSMDPKLVFAANFLAMIPLAALLSDTTEEVSVWAGERIGGLLNASFGRSVELIVVIVARATRRSDMVRKSVPAVVVWEMLFLLGCYSEYLAVQLKEHSRIFDGSTAVAADTVDYGFRGRERKRSALRSTDCWALGVLWIACHLPPGSLGGERGLESILHASMELCCSDAWPRAIIWLPLLCRLLCNALPYVTSQRSPWFGGLAVRGRMREQLLPGSSKLLAVTCVGPGSRKKTRYRSCNPLQRFLYAATALCSIPAAAAQPTQRALQFDAQGIASDLPDSTAILLTIAIAVAGASALFWTMRSSGPRRAWLVDILASLATALSTTWWFLVVTSAHTAASMVFTGGGAAMVLFLLVVLCSNQVRYRWLFLLAVPIGTIMVLGLVLIALGTIGFINVTGLHEAAFHAKLGAGLVCSSCWTWMLFRLQGYCEERWAGNVR